jgi:hypothetical protein
MYPNARFVRLSGSLRTYARNTPNMHTCMHIHMQRMCSMRMHAMFHMFRTNAPNNGGCGSSSKSVPVVDLRHSRRSAARLDLNTSCRPVSDKGFIPARMLTECSCRRGSCGASWESTWTR